MCRKVKLSIFISQRKCLINSKCYTKDPFSFTSLFISLKNALFLLLSCYHSTLRNTNCMLYHSAHPQIRLQPNTASPSLFKTNILSLLPLAAQKTLQKRPGYFADIWQPAQHGFFSFFRGEPTEGWNVLKTGIAGRIGSPWVPRATLRGRVSWDQRPQSSLEHSSDQQWEEQWAAGQDSDSKGALMLQLVAVSAGKGWERQDWQPPGCG